MRPTFPNLFLLVGLCVLLTQCGEPTPKVTSPENFRSQQAKFQYPKNWKITEEVSVDDVLMVSLESRGSMFAFISVSAPEEGNTAEAYLKTMGESLPDNVPIGNVKVGEQSDVRLAGKKGRKMPFDMNLMSETVPHTTMAFHLSNGKLEAIIYLQVPDEDLSKVKPGFELILKTFELGGEE